ncbi:MAG: hypothetical protein AMXMBFR13_22960 [Phycisphaerae bacterium]
MAAAQKQRRGAATRADIINVARQLFSEHGYHATGLADIQSATGLTKGAFYHHFRSKEELGLAVLEAAQADYATYLLEPVAKVRQPGERLRAMLDGVLGLNARPEWRNCLMVATLCAELTAGDPRLQDSVRIMQERMFGLWRKLIVEAQKSRDVDPALDPDVWAQWIINTLVGTLLTRKAGSAQVEPARLITAIKESLLGATTHPAV